MDQLPCGCLTMPMYPNGHGWLRCRCGRNHQFWTIYPEIDRRLEELRSEGRTAAEIARILGHGLTRNAIIGRAHRRGYRPLPEALRPRPSPAPEAEPPPARPAPDPRPDGLCTNHARTGCRRPAQKGYRHGLCAECNRDRLAALPRERARVIEDDGTRSQGVQRYG